MQSKPWSLSHGRGAFGSRQDGHAFAQDYDQNQEEEDDSFDEQQQRTRFQDQVRGKFGSSDLF